MVSLETKEMKDSLDYLDQLVDEVFQNDLVHLSFYETGQYLTRHAIVGFPGLQGPKGEFGDQGLPGMNGFDGNDGKKGMLLVFLSHQKTSSMYTNVDFGL